MSPHLNLYSCWCHWSLLPLAIYLKLPFLWLKCSHCPGYLPGIFLSSCQVTFQYYSLAPAQPFYLFCSCHGFSTWHSSVPSLAFVCCSWKVCFEMKTAGVCWVKLCRPEHCFNRERMVGGLGDTGLLSSLLRFSSLSWFCLSPLCDDLQSLWHLSVLS